MWFELLMLPLLKALLDIVLTAQQVFHLFFILFYQ
jgi:hypothetical protein